MSDYSKLERLAEEATAGPWSMCGEADGSEGFEIIQDIWNEHGTHVGKDVVVYEWSDESDPLGVINRKDAEFIAAANPAAVLALITDIKRLESEAVYAAAGFNAASEEIAMLRAEAAGLKTGFEAYEQVVRGLRGEVERLKVVAQSHIDQASEAAKEVMGARMTLHELGADSKTLRKDAERYRWLKINSSVMLKKTARYTTDLGLINTIYPAASELDLCLDAAMGKGEQS